MKYYVLRIKEKLIEFLFRRYIKKIRAISPVSNFESSGLIVLSMVQKKDVDMLLLAIKSFVRFVAVERFVLILDPSIDDEDIKVLDDHLVNVKFLSAKELRREGFPCGGCWERLLGIESINGEGYVIQLDADTLTLKPPVQVLNAIEKDAAFTLGTSDGQSFKSFSDSSSFAGSFIEKGSVHVQLACEFMLKDFPNNKDMLYIRGCAGFAGFPKGTFRSEMMCSINNFYSENLGDRWLEWGTEQFVSNLIISNMNKKEVLDINLYNTPYNDFGDLVFHHYIGTVRFSDLKYFNNAKKIINSFKDL